MYIYTNIIGVFVFDDRIDGELTLIDNLLFNNLEEYKKKDEFIAKIRAKHKNLAEPDEKILRKILSYYKNKSDFFKNFYARNLELTKSEIKESVNYDTLISQSINSIDELEKVINLLVKKLREWYELYNPEFSRSVKNHKDFVESILKSDKDELLKELKINSDDSVGADLNNEELEPIKKLSWEIYELYELRKNQLEYTSRLMDNLCSNTKALCGTLIGARLIAHAGSLKRLSKMPASTIQILGAETALFRHIKTGSKPPKHGIIINHPLIAQSNQKMSGKIARVLANKIAIAAKIDYFKGSSIGEKLLLSLETRFGIKFEVKC